MSVDGWRRSVADFTDEVSSGGEGPFAAEEMAVGVRDSVQNALRASSLFYIALGLLAFVRPLTKGEGRGLIATRRVRFLGIFATNPWHNLLYVAMGVAGLIPSSRPRAARLCSRVNGLAFAALALAGLFTKNLLGVIALNRADSALHGALAVLSIRKSYLSPEEELELQLDEWSYSPPGTRPKTEGEMSEGLDYEHHLEDPRFQFDPPGSHLRSEGGSTQA